MLGHEGPLTDADIEEVASRGPLYGPKGKKVPKPASAVADINKESAVPLLHTDGKPVIARVRNEGKGYKKGLDNKISQNLKEEIKKFRNDKFEELKKEKLEELGIDPEKYSGFAAGLGVERFCMVRHGVDDIRKLYTSDLRFLEQF